MLCLTPLRSGRAADDCWACHSGRLAVIGCDQTRQTPMTPLESPLTSVSVDPAARVRTGWLWQYRAGAAVLRRPAPQTPVLHRRISCRAVDAACQCRLWIPDRLPDASWRECWSS